MFPSGLDNVYLNNGQFFPVYNAFFRFMAVLPSSWQFFPVFPGFSRVFPTALSKTGISREKPNPYGTCAIGII